MAIKPSKKIAPSKPADDVEEIDDQSVDAADQTSDTAEEVTSVEEKKSVDPLTDLVRVAVHEHIQPAPRVGGVCMVRDLSVTELPVGVHRIPKVVAEVLVDRKKASYIN